MQKTDYHQQHVLNNIYEARFAFNISGARIIFFMIGAVLDKGQRSNNTLLKARTHNEF